MAAEKFTIFLLGPWDDGIVHRRAGIGRPKNDELSVNRRACDISHQWTCRHVGGLSPWVSGASRRGDHGASFRLIPLARPPSTTTSGAEVGPSSSENAAPARREKQAEEPSAIRRAESSSCFGNPPVRDDERCGASIPRLEAADECARWP